jgi:hypothetical protein
MARLVDKLEALKVAKVSKRGYYSDGNGLYLKVTASGSKSWIFRYAVNGMKRDMGLGAVHTLGLSEARSRAKEKRLMLLDGHDPLAAREKARKVEALARAREMTFDQCAVQYIAAHRNSWKNAKHGEQWISTLRTHVFPKIGTKPVAGIATEDVVVVLKPIWSRIPETASRVRGRIENFHL